MVVRSVQVLAVNPDAAVKFAQMLLTNPSGPLVDPNQVIDAFMSKQVRRAVRCCCYMVGTFG
jgi:hypothetical protein